MPDRFEGRSCAAGACALALGLGALPAAAADTEPIRIVFDAPVGCPDESAFTEQVTARTAVARLAAAGEEARTFTVTVTTRGAKVRGRLVIDDPRGQQATRDVAGGTCDEVVSALGLVTALAIDPRASTAPTVVKPPPPPPPPPPRPKEKLPPLPPYDAMPWWGILGPPLPALLGPAPEARWRAAWGLRFGGQSGAAPVILLTVGGFVEVARAGGGVLSPAFRLGFSRADSGFNVAGGHETRFALSVARAEGCPVRLAPLPEVALFPCVVFDAGALEASGLARGFSATPVRPWAAPGLGARVQGELFGRLLLEAEGGVNFPWVRDTFLFAPPSPSPPALVVPAASLFFAGGVGTHFP